MGSSSNSGLMVIDSEKGIKTEDSDDIGGDATDTDTYTVNYLDPIS